MIARLQNLRVVQEMEMALPARIANRNDALEPNVTQRKTP